MFKCPFCLNRFIIVKLPTRRSSPASLKFREVPTTALPDMETHFSVPQQLQLRWSKDNEVCLGGEVHARAWLTAGPGRVLEVVWCCRYREKSTCCQHFKLLKLQTIHKLRVEKIAPRHWKLFEDTRVEMNSIQLNLKFPQLWGKQSTVVTCFVKIVIWLLWNLSYMKILQKCIVERNLRSNKMV